MSISIAIPTEAGTQQFSIALPVGGIKKLREFVKICLGQPESSVNSNFILTDALKDICTDEDVAQLRDGSVVMVALGNDGALVGPTKERISFQPHPKTLTMAGDYEYFAAQGRHPFVYALAEFVDNSLRATRNNPPKTPQEIIIHILTAGSGASKRGMICIQDNGCGMSKTELRDWAVMNYTMEERGLSSEEATEMGNRLQEVTRKQYLTGNLSYFGVGSKNAAFFMGSTVKVVTRKAEERYVHELTLAAEDLEKRYRNQEAVYEEDMVHRNPGDTSTLGTMEARFPVTHSWVHEEVKLNAAGPTSGFTRVMIGDLKPQILRQLADDQGGAKICTELAHLYHYYIHGQDGNNRTNNDTEVRKLLKITVQYQKDNRLVWEKSLRDVEDDFETTLLRTQRAEFSFSLTVPEYGVVAGNLYYFPYENGRETVPFLPSLLKIDHQLHEAFAGNTQHGTATQNATLPQSIRSSAVDGDLSDGDDATAYAFQAPIFETFWQGRLIPDSRISTLGFVEAVRRKRNATSKDALPDEVFRRLRGTLFFGPAFHVTRNKLLFRDDLHEILSSGISLDRNLEKRFKEWLTQCHSNLDRIIRFNQLCSTKRQAEVRSIYGESITAFDRISDGQKSIESGVFLKIIGKPAVVGQVKYFTVPLVVRQEGAYASGRVHLQLLPAEVYAENNLHTFSLRRVDCILSEEQVTNYATKELGKLPSVLRIEPMKLTTGNLTVTAGDSVPESSVSIVNGHGAKLSKAFFNGEKQSLTVIQRLWLRPPASNSEQPNDTVIEEQTKERECKEIAKKGKGRSRHTRKGATIEEVGKEASISTSVSIKTPTLVFEVENKAPRKDTYYFSHINDATGIAGDYSLEFFVAQTPQGHECLKYVVPLKVHPSSPSNLKVSGEGAAAVALKEIVLGEELPQFSVTLVDSYGNKVPGIKRESISVHVQFAEDVRQGPAQGHDRETNEIIALNYRLEDLGDRFAIHELRCSGSLIGDLQQQMQRRLSTDDSQPNFSQGLAHVPATLKFQVSEQFEDSVSVTLCPGVPQKISLVASGEWDEQGLHREIPSGEELPELKVRLYDSWGNVTGPNPRLPFDVVVGSDALVPNSQTFSVDDNGVATISGFTAAHTFSGPANLLVRIACKPGCEALRKALQVAQPLQELKLNFTVSASTFPVALRLSYNGETVDMRTGIGEENGDIAILQGIETGSSISGLRLSLVDSSGQDAATTVNGKVIVSWRKGSKRISWDGSPIKLPTIKVPDSTTEIINEFVRFQGDSSFPIVLECGLEVRPIPGEPANWAVSLADSEAGRSHVEESGTIRSGQRFTLEIEALDSRMNRCVGLPGTIAEPVVLLESEGPLEFNPEEWEKGWITQGGHDIYLVHMTVTGHPGAIQVTVKDTSGPAGESLLNSDTLTLELRPGNPTRLTFEGPPSISCSTRSLLGPLEVKLCDSSGYPTTSTESIDVALVGSALACDGSGRAARVVCNGSNKIKISRGDCKAIFKQISVYAEEGGTYALRVQSSSRKLSLQEGVLQLDMTAEVVVTGLEVQPLFLKEGGSDGESLRAGVLGKFLVHVFLEGGLDIPMEVVRSGLSLVLKPPNDAEVLSCTMDVEESDGLSVDGVEGGSESNRFVFVSPKELCVAGNWTAMAEYEEPRVNLKAALGKSARLRSASIPFDLVAGPPVKAVLAGSCIPDKMAITNSSSTKARTLLRGAAVEIKDMYGNIALGDGIEVRFKLHFSNTNTSPDYTDDFPNILPELDFEVKGPVISVDESGRAYFGNISIVEGSGKAGNGTLECYLICEARGLYPCHEVDMDADDEGWVVAWRCFVLFSDNSSNAKQLEELNDERGRLIARQSLITKDIEAAEHAHQVALNRGNTVSRNMKILQDSSSINSFPSTLEMARKECDRIKERLSGLQEKVIRHARWGPEKALMTAAIHKVLDSGEKGVIGVFAQLVTVEDETLARVASAALRGLLPVVILQDTNVRDVLSKYLSSHKYPLPDTLALTHINAYRGSVKDDLPGFSNANDVARFMTKAACMGTDPPLPIPLPHQKRQNPKSKDSMKSLSWPEGCVGYLVNLLRPVHAGHRASVLYALCSGILVFESLAHGSAYREMLTSKLNMACPCDIISLDGGRISSRGIVSGASFRPPLLETADFVIGASATNAADTVEEDRLRILHEWIRLLEEKAAVEQVARETEESLSALQARYEAEIRDLDAQVREIDIKVQSISNNCRDKTRINAEYDERGVADQNLNEERMVLTTLNTDDDVEGQRSRKIKRRRTGAVS